MSKKATREAYGCALKELAVSNKNVVVLDADLAAATKTGAFKKAFPERFFDDNRRKPCNCSTSQRNEWR